MSHLLEQAAIPLLLTLRVAGVATLGAGLAGIMLGKVLAGRSFPGSRLLDAVGALPLVLPPTVLGYYLLVVFGRQGYLGNFLQQKLGVTLVFTWWGAALAAMVVAFPLVYKSARAAFESVDPDYEHVARTLGASRTGAFFRVTLPLAGKGLLAGMMLAFARSLGEFGATLMVAGNIPGKTQTMSLAIYSAVAAGDDRLANILVLLISATCVILLVTIGKLLEKKAV